MSKHNFELRKILYEDKQRIYICTVCKVKVLFIAPFMFPIYEKRYDDLLEEAKIEECPGIPLIPKIILTHDLKKSSCDN